MTDLINDEFPPPPDLTRFIVRADDRYLSGGCYGDVYRCLYHAKDVLKQVAVKAFRFRLMGTSDKSTKMIRRELGIWRRLKHNNIVPFLGIAYGFGMQDAVSLVSSWMPNGTLASFLEKYDSKLGVAHRLRLLLDIANGLHYLHSLLIIHGDLYCNNVLIDADRTARLVDFGFASLVGNIPDALSYLERSTTRPGALRWAAPERVVPEEGSKLTTKDDIYSFGCISLQESFIVLSGKKPWSEVKEDGHIVLRIAQGCKPARPESRAIDDRHWAFIERCWLSPQERPLAKEIIASIKQFLSSYPQLPPKTTSDASSFGSLGDGMDAKELFGEFRNDLARRILKQHQHINPSGSTRKQSQIGRDGVRGVAEVSLKVYFEYLPGDREHIHNLFFHHPDSSPSFKIYPVFSHDRVKEPPQPTPGHDHSDISSLVYRLANSSRLPEVRNHRSSTAPARDNVLAQASSVSRNGRSPAPSRRERITLWSVRTTGEVSNRSLTSRLQERDILL